MSSVKRAVRIAAASAVMIGAGVVWVGPASATVVGSGNCFLPDPIYSATTIEYDGVGDDVWKPLELSNGVLEAEFINDYTGLDVEYIKNGGSTISGADFTAYNCATGKQYWDSGSFSESAGQTKSYAFNSIGSMSDNCGTAALQVPSQDAVFEIDLCN